VTALTWSVRAVVALPVLAALVIVLLPRGRRAAQAAVAVAGALGATGAALVELVLVAGGQVAAGTALLPPVPTGQGTVHLAVRADQLSAAVAVMVAVVALCVQVYSIAHQAGDPRYRAYAASVSLFTAAMLVVVQADDLLLLLIGWEVMGLCSYLLVGHDSQRAAARTAAVKAFLVTRAADVALVVAVLVLWVAGGTTSVTELLSPARLTQIGAPALTAAGILLVVAVAGKSAQLPFSTWLPDAMEGPTPVSALIHAATMVAAGGVLLARLLPLLLAAPAARATLAVVTSLTMLGAALVALVQTDLKRVLAWSTISQVGYLLAALAVAPAGLGPAPSLAHLLSHAGFKALLFLSAGALAHGGRSTDLSGLAGAGRRSPLAAAALTLGLAALAGLPPLSGFWSKEAVLGAAEAALHDGAGPAWPAWAVLISGLLTGLITAGYAARTWWLVVPGRPEPADLADGGRRLPPAMAGPLVLLAVPTAFGGLLLMGPALPGRVEVGLPLAAAAAGLAVLGVGASLVVGARLGDPAALVPARLRRVLIAGYGLDTAQHHLVVRPARGLARWVSVGDRDVVDAYVRAAARAARWGGWLLRRSQTGVASGYLTWLAAGAVAAVVAGLGLR
jgi:NADH-quinone oxidoreductase subunit L